MLCEDRCRHAVARGVVRGHRRTWRAALLHTAGAGIVSPISACRPAAAMDFISIQSTSSKHSSLRHEHPPAHACGVRNRAESTSGVWQRKLRLLVVTGKKVFA